MWARDNDAYNANVTMKLIILLIKKIKDLLLLI